MSLNVESQRPEWRKISHSGKAHLVNHAVIGKTAWCGLDLMSSVEGHYDERCKPCVEAVQAFVDAVLIDPPTTVTEQYVVQVTRPATSESFQAVLDRKFRSMTTWTVDARLEARA